ncbi:MAG: GNAT family N-acetyltransferase [Vitreimonas sp.]
MSEDASPAPMGPIERIGPKHIAADFDCGYEELNTYLTNFALTNTRAGGAVTRVVARTGVVAGYYSLAAGSASPAHVPERVAKGLGRYPVPLVILARLAVDRREQGAGLGAALLKDALLGVCRASNDIGVRALVAHAKDDRAKAFYERAGFMPSPTDPLHMFLVMKDLRALISS